MSTVYMFKCKNNLAFVIQLEDIKRGLQFELQIQKLAYLRHHSNSLPPFVTLFG